MTSSRRSLDAVAIAAMAVLSTLWALQQVSIKQVAADATPTAMMAWRSTIAALCVAALIAWRGGGIDLRTGRWRAGLVVGLLFGIEFLCIGESLRRTHASHVVVLLYCAPIFAALGLAWRQPDERLDTVQWIGMALAFAGVAVAFLGRSHGAAGLTDAMLVGDAFALAAGLFWGATTVAVRTSSLSQAPPAETLLYQLLGASVLIAIAAAASGQLHVRPTPSFALHLALQAVVISFASYLAWFWLLLRYRAAPLGVLTFMTPLLGVAFGVVLLGETPEPAMLGGGALVLGGVLLMGLHAAWVARRTP